MNSISSVLTEQNRHGDERFALLGRAVLAGDWRNARALADEASAQAQRHMLSEEDVLFDTLEQMLSSESTTNPLRREHEELRRLLGELHEAIRIQDAALTRTRLEALEDLRRRHNEHSEQHLYPLADKVLGKLAPALAQEMAWD